MKLNELADRPGANKPKKRLGRGIGSGKGKTAGRGVKGQKARSGVSVKGFEGGQMPLQRRLPKRGFTPLDRTEYQVVNLYQLEKLEGDGPVTPESLKASGLIGHAGRPVKVLGTGELTRKLDVTAHKFSQAARDKIAAQGGTVQEIG